MPSAHRFLSLLTQQALKPRTLTQTVSIALLRPFSSSPKPAKPAAAASSSNRVALYLRRARLIDSLRLRLRSHPTTTTLPTSVDPIVAAHALRAAPSPDAALALFRSLPPSLSSHPSPIHSLARRLSLSRRLPDLQLLLSSSPLPPSPIDRLSYLAAAGDLPSSLDLFETSIRHSARRPHPCTESYNLIMSLYVANALDAKAVSLFSQMVDDGANPNSRTYTIIIDHLIRSGNVDRAKEIFDLLPFIRIRRTSKQYNLLAESLEGRLDDLAHLLDEMRSDGILPGPRMRSVIAMLHSAGRIGDSDELVKDLSPDDRIGYAAGSDSEDDGNGDADVDGVRLRPWIDPAALAKALDGWEPEEVSALEAAGFVWTSRLVCKLLRGFKKAETSWAFFCWVAYQPGGFTHDRQTVSRMVAILARNGHVELVDRLLDKVRVEKINLPFATVRLVIDFYGISKRADAALKIFHDADSLCGPISEPRRMLLYSSLLRTIVKCRKGGDAMDILEEMLSKGVRPDAQIFSGLMEFFAGDGDLKSVHKVFGMVRQCGIEPDAYMCQVLIRAHCKNERAALALRVFEEMRSSNLMPDLATKNLLVKSLWKEGKLREAASVEERCEEAGEGLPTVSPGHVWTVSYADFRRVYNIYSGCFKESSGQGQG